MRKNWILNPGCSAKTRVAILLASARELVALFLSSPRDFLLKAGLAVGRYRAGQYLLDKVSADMYMPIDIVSDDFDRPILTVNPRPRERTGAPRVLYFVNSCLPYTSSGYTLRTQALLEAAGDKGLPILPITRLGYPALVGKVAHGASTSVGSIEYYHLLPVAAPLRREKREERVLELLAQLVVRKDIDILHTTTDFRNAALVSQVARRTGRPWVYEVRGERDQTLKADALQRSKRIDASFLQTMRSKENDAMRAANAVIALSDVSARSLVQRGIESTKIHVLPNGISSPATEPRPLRVRQMLGIDDQQVVVGAITSVVFYEGLDTLLEALEFLPPSFIVLVVGTGTALPELEILAKKLELNDRVIFAGQQSRETIADWYAALDVFAMPRRNLEVCQRVTPIKSLQAMQLGIPVVASDLPALREVTGGFASYVEPGCPEKLAQGIEDALHKRVDAEEKARRRRFLEQRSWEAVADRLQGVYDDLT